MQRCCRVTAQAPHYSRDDKKAAFQCWGSVESGRFCYFQQQKDLLCSLLDRDKYRVLATQEEQSVLAKFGLVVPGVWV